MYFLTKELYFPSVATASSEGIVAIGGDLSSERLLLAYKSGIFPWFEDDEPILWWSPPERMVLLFENLKISKSMRSILSKNEFKVTFNTAFKEVILNYKKNGETYLCKIEAYPKFDKEGNFVNYIAFETAA